MGMVVVVTLLVAGILLLLAETILPGMIAGILGAICLLAGVVAAYHEFEASTGHAIVLGLMVLLAVGTGLWLTYFPDSRVAAVFVSKKTVGNINAEQPLLLHQTGNALSNLRPSGLAMINGQRVDVISEGGMIERGSFIKVVALEGLRVVVRSEVSAANPKT